MLATPLWIQLIHGFFTGCLSAGMGLVLVNIRPQLRKLLLTGLLYDIGVLLIWSIRTSFQIRFLTLTLFLLLTVNFIWRLGLFRSLITIALGTLVLILGESIFVPFLLRLFEININQIMDTNIILFLPFPQIILTILLIVICVKGKFHLFNFSKYVKYESFILTGKRYKLVLGLVSTVVILLILQILCNITVYTMRGFNSLPLNMVGYFSNIIIILVCISIALLVIQLLELTEKESKYEIQTSYLETIEELYAAIRGQQHDLVNHLQVLYGFLQMGNVKEVEQYLITLMGESVNSHNLIDTGNPGLSALLYIKSGIALANDIDFRININNKITNINVPSYELNRIVGNIINNAFDHVMKLEDRAKRVVQFQVNETEQAYCFEISNFGNIDEAIKSRLFERGFSTKEGEHSGLGLYIVKNLVNRCEGFLEVLNREQQVVFSIHLPQKQGEDYKDASFGSKDSGVTSREFRLPVQPR